MTGLPALLKIGQAAQRLGVGVITIRAWVRHDRLAPAESDNVVNLFAAQAG